MAFQYRRPGDNGFASTIDNGQPSNFQSYAPPAPSGGAANTGMAAGGPASATGGTGWTNLQAVFGMNQPAAQKMAAGVEGNYASQANAYNQGANALRSNYQQYLNGQATSGQGAQSAQEWNPAGYGNLINQGNQLQQYGREAGSQGGLAQIFGQQAGQQGQQYTGGQGALDAFLAGTAGGQNLQNLGGGFRDLGQTFSGMSGVATPTNVAQPATYQGDTSGVAAQPWTAKSEGSQGPNPDPSQPSMGKFGVTVPGQSQTPQKTYKKGYGWTYS